MEIKTNAIEFKTNHGEKGWINSIGQSGVSLGIKGVPDLNILLFGTEVDDFCELLKQVQEEGMRHYPTEKKDDSN